VGSGDGVFVEAIPVLAGFLEHMREREEVIPEDILWFAVFGVDESFGLGVAVH